MTPEFWTRITELFGEMLDLPVDRRAPFLARIAGDDPAAARELAALIEEHERPGEFLPSICVAAPVVITDLSGSSAGAYRLVRFLGGGGMGAVYLAERSDGAFSKQVAVKVLSPAFVHAQERFQQERELLARLEHPNVARLLDGGTTTAGLPYLVVEYVDGVPIDRYCAERNLPLGERLGLLLQLCAGITHAHQHLIIHRDIKPDNVLVTGGGAVKILDFGIATLRDSTRAATLQRPATPIYSSPEQLSGAPMTTASDVYSIGVVAFELLTGHLPYDLKSNHIGEILHAVLTAQPFAPSQAPGLAPHRARRLRGDLDNILLRAIAKEPGRRYASAQQLAEDIERYGNGFPVRARPDTIPYRMRKFVGRYRAATALVALTTMLLVAGITVSVWQARVARRRFEDVRQFAHTIVFDVNDTLSTIPGTTAARKQVVETALRYLDRLGRDGVPDPRLREEIAAAYLRIGRVQGGAFLANLGDSAGAIESFRKAIAAVGRSDATAGLKRIEVEAHINIALLAQDPIQSVPDLDAAIHAAEQWLAVEPNDVETLRLIADACNGRATVGHATDHVVDEEVFSRREIEFRRRRLALAPTEWRAELALTDAIAQHALALEQQTDYAGSLAELREAASILERVLVQHPGNQLLLRNLAEKRSRTGSVLLAMSRAAESQAALENAIEMLAPLVDAEPGNAQFRGDLAYAWYRLAETLRARGQLARALALHRQALTVRRERVARDPGFTFIRWDLSRSLNSVGELLLLAGPPEPAEAARLFAEARELAARTLEIAPSFNELRKQVARADEGLGRAALAASPRDAAGARAHFEESLLTWRDVLTRGGEDRREAGAPQRLEQLLSLLP